MSTKRNNSKAARTRSMASRNRAQNRSPQQIRKHDEVLFPDPDVGWCAGDVVAVKRSKVHGNTLTITPFGGFEEHVVPAAECELLYN